MVDVAGHDSLAEGQAGDDGRLGPGVVALDIGGGVALGVAQALGLGQGIGVAGPLLGHAGEDEVGGAVDDPHHPGHVLAGEGLPQGAHEGDAPGHRGLEEQVDACVLGGRRQLGAVVGQQLLVGGHHRLAGAQGGEGQLPGRLDAADDLDHQVDVGVAGHRRGVGGEHAVGQGDATVAGEAAHRHPGHLEADPGALGDGVAPLGEQPHEGGADVAAAEEPHPEGVLVATGGLGRIGGRGHGRRVASARPRPGRCWRRWSGQPAPGRRKRYSPMVAARNVSRSRKAMTLVIIRSTLACTRAGSPSPR